VTSVAQSAMHLAARLAEQLTCASTDARSSHPIFASTPQVALQEAEHLPSHVSELVLLQSDEHWSAHCEPQSFWHWSTSSAPAHTAWQLPLHCVLHVMSHAEVAWAAQFALQSEPHAVRQLPVASAPHVVFDVAPMSAWHAVVVSICAHVNGHWSFAVSTQFWSRVCNAEAELAVAGPQAPIELATMPRAARGAIALTAARCSGRTVIATSPNGPAGPEGRGALPKRASSTTPPAGQGG
jgi:hypothetical protein